MKSSAIKILGLALACGPFARPAAADLVVTPGSSSSVSASATLDATTQLDGDSVAYPGAASFVGAASADVGAQVSASSSQSSTVPDATGTSITATGTASHSLSLDPGQTGSAQATSLLDVFFELSGPHSFTYTRSGTDDSTFAAATVELSRFDGSGYIPFLSDNGSFSLSDTGLLTAGQYRLRGGLRRRQLLRHDARLHLRRHGRLPSPCRSGPSPSPAPVSCSAPSRRPG